MLYIRICVLLYVCSAVYETRTYGAMRGARGVIPYIYSILFLYQVLQILVSSDAIQLVLDNLLDILLDSAVVIQNSLLHAVGTGIMRANVNVVKIIRVNDVVSKIKTA